MDAQSIPDVSVFLQPSPAPTHLESAHFPGDAARVYSDALEVLTSNNVACLVGGALALNYYTGIWRHTKDLDLFIRERDVPGALSLLAQAGFEVGYIYRSWLSKAWRGDIFVDFIHRNANALHPVDDEWFAHAQPHTLLGYDVRVMPLEDLIVSKMFVGGRYRFDGADIAHILFRAHDRIDWERLIDRAGDHVGLLPVYVAFYRYVYPAFTDRLPPDLDARLAQAIEARRRDAPAFRGTLLDLNSFTVDVEALGLPDLHARVLQEIGHTA